MNRLKNTERFRKYRQTKNGILSVKKAVKKYEKNNPKRRHAWDKVRSVVLQPCEVCGEFPTHRHHPDPNKPLEIIFLCPLHHKHIHLSLKELKKLYCSVV